MVEINEVKAQDTATQADAAADTPAGPAGAADDENTAHYSWNLVGVSKLSEPRYYSPPFKCGPYDWHIMVLPPTEHKPHLGVYLAVKDHHLLPIGWRRCAVYSLHMVNYESGERMTKEVNHKFIVGEQDWGWRTFVSRENLEDSKLGWVRDDTVQLEASVRYLTEEEYEKAYPPHQSVSYYSYDSKKETGMVGLVNSGATCYMNSLLQSMYNTPEFRRAVFKMETRDIADAQKSIPLALQRLFYRMQFDVSGVSTKELTTSFGWDTMDLYTQQDVQELNRLLLDNLEEKMKGTPAEGTMDKLYRGKLSNMIECLKIDYKTRHPEIFYDLSLMVKGHKSLYESLDKYVEKNLLVGDNQYNAKEHGKQDAAMGVVFEELPCVLQLHLKRFHYDYNTQMNIKVTDRFEFPQALDMDRYLSDQAVRTVPQRYQLMGVWVHSGTGYGGHYYCFLHIKGKWYKFDDERVTVTTPEQVFEHSFGGKETVQYYGRLTYTTDRVSSAYMLMYVRESDAEWVLRDVMDEEVPPHLHERFREEKQEEERKQKEKAEAHLYCQLQLVVDKYIQDHTGPDLCNLAVCETVRMQKAQVFSEFRHDVAARMNVDPAVLRFTRFSTRHASDKHQRPTMPILPADEDKTIGVLFSYASNAAVHVEIVNASTPPLPSATEAQLYFKEYDPTTQRLRYIGRRVLPLTTQLRALPAVAAAMLNEPAEGLLLYQEMSPRVCTALPLDDFTLDEARFGSGDIVVVQRKPAPGLKCPTADVFFEYLANRVMVKVKPLAEYRNEKLTFVLELNLKNKHEEVAEAVAKHLELPAESADKIRFTGHMSYYEQPRGLSLKRSENPTLQDMLSSYYSTLSDTLYYEVLDLSVAEYETKQVAKVCWRDARGHVEKEIKLLVPKNCLVSDVVAEVRHVLDVAAAEPIRMFEVFDHKIWKLMSPNDTFYVYGDSSSWHCEIVPPEQRKLADGMSLVRVAHFARDSFHSMLSHFGVPLYTTVLSTDTGADVKAKLKAQLGVSDADWAEWNVHLVSSATPRPLEDSASMGKFHFGQYGDYIGLEHRNTDPPKAGRGGETKQMRIKG